MTGQLLTVAEVAVELRCHEKTVRRMIQRGELPARLVAGKYLIDLADLPTRSTRPDPASVPAARVEPKGDGPAVQAGRRVLASRKAAA